MGINLGYWRLAWLNFKADWRRFWLLDEPTVERRRAPSPGASPGPAVPALRVWRAMRFGGGGVFDTPQLGKDAAIEFVTRRGTHSIAYVDDENGYIFYGDRR